MNIENYDNRRSKKIASIVIGLTCVALATKVFLSFTSQWLVVWDAAPYLLKALGASWLLCLSSIGIGFPVAVALAASRSHGPIIVRQFAIVYIETIRAIPQIMVIFWVFFSAPMVIGVTLEPWPAAIIALSMIASSYLAEVIRAGLNSVPRIQSESAYAAGFSSFHRFTLILLPQALRNMLPALIAHIIMMFKITSLVYVIGVVEFFRASILVNNREFAPYAIYITMGVGYFICNYVLSLVIRKLDPEYTLTG